MNRWNIPTWLEEEIRERDKRCVYCDVKFGEGGASRKDSPTGEHIVNDARIITRENIALCCFSCNASKGAKDLSDWLNSGYCVNKGMTENTVADVVKRALIDPPKLSTADA